MTDETTAAEVTTETVTQQVQEQPARIDYGRIERQAKIAATDPQGFEAMRRGYEEAGGTYFKDLEAQSKSNAEGLAKIERERAIERALRVYNLTDDDVDLLTGATPKDIDAQAQKLRARLDKEKPAAEAETETATKTQPELVQYQQQAQLTPQQQRAKDLRDAVTAGVKAGTWRN